MSVDARVLAFTLIVSVGSGLLFGLLPAVHAKQARLLSGGGGQRESSRRATRRLNNALVVAQLSLSVVLLVAAGLVLKSFHRLTGLDLGFRAEGVTSIAFTVPPRIGSSALATKAFVTTRAASACGRFPACSRRRWAGRSHSRATATLTDSSSRAGRSRPRAMNPRSSRRA